MFDTSAMQGTGKETRTQSYTDSPVAATDCPSYHSSYFEHITYRFNSYNLLLNKMAFDFYITGDSAHTTMFKLTLNEKDVASDALIHMNDEPGYKDTLTIGGNLYRGISIPVYPPEGDAVATVLYNRNLGILKIQYKNGKTWIRQF
jgi:hypothetical protein